MENLRFFKFKLGDGNEGEYYRFLVAIKQDENPYAALKALIVNEYMTNAKGTKYRRHISKNIILDGEEEFGIIALVDEGPKHETAFGAAWLTATLEPHEYDEDDNYVFLKDQLDHGAKIIYKRYKL